ncbi:MAG: helix-turn-helix transcriptional regulator [Bacteroidota bacterium]
MNNTTIHILKINEIAGHKVYCLFNNGEYRVIDFNQLLDHWQPKPTNILYELYDSAQLKQVIVENSTLTWPNIRKTIKLSSGKEMKVKLDLDPIVLYQNSEIDTQRDSAFRLGQELKRAREAKGLTQEQLAQKVGVSRSSVSKIENNKSGIGYKTLQKIVEIGLNKRLVIMD